MKTFPITEEGQGVDVVDAATLSHATRVVIDGKKVHVYEHGDEIAEHHTHEAMTGEDKPAAAKKKK